MQKLIEVVKERKFKYISFFWFLISTQFVIGNNLQTKGYSVNSFADFLNSLLKIILFSVMFVIFHYCILELYNKKNKKKNKINKVQDKKKINKIEKYKCGIYFVIIIICWIPALLAFCPIIANYDGVFQIEECITQSIYTRHPILHTLLLTIFYLFGFRNLNSCSSGMLLFTIFQMTIMALIFSYAVKFIEERTNKKWIRNISLIFYAIFPFNQLFPLMTTKDVLFAGFVLLFIIKLYKMLEEKYNLIDYICAILIAVLMISFRNNAIYAIIISIPFIVLILFKNKQKMLKVILSCIIVVITYKIFNNGLIYITNAGIDSNREKLSVFSQATAKICNEKEEELTEEEKTNISFYFKDYKKLGRVYKSNISDPTKILANCKNIDNNKIDFIKFMIELGVKYPRQFVDSFLNTTRGYWYICDESFNKIQNEQYPDTKGCLELTFDEVAKEKYKLEDYSVLPELRNFYRKMFCHNDYTKIPVLYIIFQPAIYFYAVIAYLLYCMYKKEESKMIIGIFLFLYFITCFLGPVAIIRYIYAVIVSMPVILGLVLETNKNKGV